MPTMVKTQLEDWEIVRLGTLACTMVTIKGREGGGALGATRIGKLKEKREETKVKSERLR